MSLEFQWFHLMKSVIHSAKQAVFAANLIRTDFWPIFESYLASISLVWSVRIELSALTMTAIADVTPAFNSLFTRLSMKSFLS